MLDLGGFESILKAKNSVKIPLAAIFEIARFFWIGSVAGRIVDWIN
jgi:hypothetical protein